MRPDLAEGGGAGREGEGEGLLAAPAAAGVAGGPGGLRGEDDDGDDGDDDHRQGAGRDRARAPWPGGRAREAGAAWGAGQALQAVLLQRSAAALAAAACGAWALEAADPGGAALLRPAWTSLLLVALTVAYYWDSRESWHAEGAAARSVMVSCPAFQGSSELVPDGPALADFFAEKYGPVENVLTLLDIGQLVRLRRLRTELRAMASATEREQQRWRPLRGVLPRLPCCRVCRRLARRAGDRRQDRFRRWMERIDDRIADLESTHQVESLGCAVVTFESAKDAGAVMRDSLEYIHVVAGDDEDQIFFDDDPVTLAQDGAGMRSPRPGLGAAGAPQGAQRDHAQRWWFSPARELRSRYGEDMQPIFVRAPPAPDDLNFEAMTPGANFDYPSRLRTLVVVACGALLATAGLATGAATGHEVLTRVSRDPTTLEALLGAAGALVVFAAIALPHPRLRLLPERPYLTFSQAHGEHFRLAMVLGLVFLSTLASSSWAAHAPGVMVMLSLVFEVASLARAVGRLVWAALRPPAALDAGQGAAVPPPPLALMQAEAVMLVALPAFASAASSSVLAWAAVGAVVRLFIEDAIARNSQTAPPPPSTPKLGPNVAVAAMRALAAVACVVVALPTLLHVWSGASLDVSSGRALFFAMLMSSLSLTFFLGWVFAESARPALFRVPTGDVHFPTVAESDGEGDSAARYYNSELARAFPRAVNISFDAGLSKWNHVDLLPQRLSGSQAYRLPSLRDVYTEDSVHGGMGRVL